MKLFKHAMPVALDPQTLEKMRDEGWFQAPGESRTPPEVGIKKMKEIDQEDLSLPKIYRYRTRDVRTINGKKYLVIFTEEPKEYKRITAATPKHVTDRLVGNHYPGLVRAINLETSNVEEFDYEAVMPEVAPQSAALSEESRKEVNKEIAVYNARIDKIDAAVADLTRIPLQLARAQDYTEDRIKDLDGIISHTEQELAAAKAKKPESLEGMEQMISERIQGGNLPERDFKEHVLAKYVMHYDQLVKDLDSGTLQIPANIPDPEALKAKLRSMGDLAFKEYVAAKESRLEEKVPEEPFDIENQDIVGLLQDLPPGSVPVQHTTTGYHSFEGYVATLYAILAGSKKNRVKLQGIATGLLDLQKMIGGLGEGERSMTFLQTTEKGKQILKAFAEECNARLKAFTQSYKKDIVNEQGSIDTSKFGRSGSIGNAMLIVVYTRLFKIVSTFLKRAGYASEPPAAAAVPAPAAQPQPEMAAVPAGGTAATEAGPTAAVKKTVVKMSKASWTATGLKAGWLEKSSVDASAMRSDLLAASPKDVLAAIHSFGPAFEQSVAGFSGMTEEDVKDVINMCEDYEIIDIWNRFNKQGPGDMVGGA